MPRLLPTLSASLLFATAMPALQAQETVVEVHAEAPQQECVEVEVQGRREQSLACLGAKLLPPGQAAVRRPPPLSGAQATIERPSNQLGLYNRAALQHRMGNAFGKSVVPQRPSTPPAASPLLPAR